MKSRSFLDVLQSSRVLLMDGAMGTQLQRAGLQPGENAAAWNLLKPTQVRAVHEAYRKAGAAVCLTNTFMVNARSLYTAMQASDRHDGIAELWAAAYENIGPDVFRIAAVGPVAGNESAREFDQPGRFFISLNCAVDRPHRCCHTPHAILLETCSTPRVGQLIRYIRRWWEFATPILVSLTFQHNTAGDLVTHSGHAPEWFAQRAKAYGLSALGVNCGRDISIADCAEIVRRYRKATDLPLFARPNAGTPKKAKGQWVYPLSPAAMAAQVPELLEAGVSMIGGCCGTTPEHIAALKPVVARWNRR